MKSQILIYTLVLTGMLIICFVPVLTLYYIYNNNGDFQKSTKFEINALLTSLGLSKQSDVIAVPDNVPETMEPSLKYSETQYTNAQSTKYTQYAMENGSLITDLYQTNDKMLMYKTYFRDCYTGEVTGDYTQFRGSWCFIPEDALELRRLFKVYFTADLTVTQKRAYESEIFSIINKGTPK